MRDVIEQMKEDSCECKDSVFVSVIKTYANVGLVDEADKVVRILWSIELFWMLYAYAMLSLSLCV